MLIVLAGIPAYAVGAQQTSQRDGVRIREEVLAPGLSVLSLPEGNLLVRTTRNEIFLAGSASPAFLSAVRSRLRGRATRWIALFYSDSARADGDGGWGAEGVVTVAHESLRNLLAAAARDSTLRRRPAVPRLGFSQVMQIALDGDDAHLVHQPRGYSMSDVIVHLEDSNVILLGHLYASDGYPALTPEAGSRLNGLIDVVSTFARVFGDRPDVRFVPGTGPVSGGARLKEYRDMLVTVRARIREAIKRGESEDQVARSAITQEFDEQWGHGRIGSSAFLHAAFRSLVADSTATSNAPSHH